jgi:hypothetical protein
MHNNDAYWLTRSYVPNGIKEQVAPYILPFDHPARKLLDQTYQGKDELTTIDRGRNSTLKKLPELLEKHGLVIKERNHSQFEYVKSTTQLRSVQGHFAGRQFIEKNKITHVKVTQNWLYPLPGEANKKAFIVYNLAVLVRKVLNALHITSPQWLKYGDTILRDRFIVVEEFIDIEHQKFNINSLSKDITDQYSKVFQVVGFQDAHELNYSLAKDGTITLFDLDQYSKKQEKNVLNGKLGMNILDPDRYPRPLTPPYLYLQDLEH